MRSERSLLLRMRVWTAILLAAIGLQAAEPIRAPLQRVQGSAFSVSTLDVVIVSGRRGEAEAPVSAPLPPPRLVTAVRAFPALAIAALPASPRLRPAARGPPPRRHSASPPDSTAPPRA